MKIKHLRDVDLAKAILLADIGDALLMIPPQSLPPMTYVEMRSLDVCPVSLLSLAHEAARRLQKKHDCSHKDALLTYLAEISPYWDLPEEQRKLLNELMDAYADSIPKPKVEVDTYRGIDGEYISDLIVDGVRLHISNEKDWDIVAKAVGWKEPEETKEQDCL